MKMEKHTKGKWVVEINTTTLNKDIFVSIENSSAIARIFDDNSAVKNREEAIANAKLIAAAPELLEAIHKINNELSFIETEYLTIAEKNMLLICSDVIKKID